MEKTNKLNHLTHIKHYDPCCIEIIDERFSDKNEIKIQEILPGAVFLFKNEIYMKISGWNIGNQAEYNAVNLHNGDVEWIQDSDIIEPIKTELIIEENILKQNLYK